MNEAITTATTIDIQGEPCDVLEVYADESKEQTLGFVFEDKDAQVLFDAHEAHQHPDKHPSCYFNCKNSGICKYYKILMDSGINLSVSSQAWTELYRVIGKSCNHFVKFEQE